MLVPIDAKQVQKRSTVTTEVPTVAPSDDHTDGTWNDTDVYSGELFINEADGKVFIRIAAEIYSFGLKRQEFTVGGGGQTVFTLDENILNDVAVYEDGVLTTRTITITDTNEVTIGSSIPEGTAVTILY